MVFHEGFHIIDPTLVGGKKINIKIERRRLRLPCPVEYLRSAGNLTPFMIYKGETTANHHRTGISCKTYYYKCLPPTEAAPIYARNAANVEPSRPNEYHRLC